jgi:hypothetical protein
MATAPLFKLDAQDTRCAFLTFADGCDKLVLRAPTRADLNAADFTPATDAEVQQAFDLIAAAPALLEALKAAVPALERLGDFVGNVDHGGASGLGTIDRCALLLKVRDAIAKAGPHTVSTPTMANVSGDAAG